MCRENPMARRTNGVDVRPQVAQEDRLADDRGEACPLGFEHVEDRAIDRVGLPVRLRHVRGWLAVEEQFPGRGSFDPTQHDRAVVRLDRLGTGMGRHCEPLSGDGSWLHARTVPGGDSAFREPVAARRHGRRAAGSNAGRLDQGFLQPSVGSTPSSRRYVKPAGLFFSKQLPVPVSPRSGVCTKRMSTAGRGKGHSTAVVFRCRSACSGIPGCGPRRDPRAALHQRR